MVTFPNNLMKKFCTIKLLATDVDGVLTDGGMYYSRDGDELKKFNVRDGMGIRLLQKHGIHVSIITSEKIKIVERRAEKLKITDLYQGVQDKAIVIRELANKFDISLQEIAYIGDDINDLSALQIVGLAITVADGLPDNKNIAHYVTCAKGGEGAVREVASLILSAKATPSL